VRARPHEHLNRSRKRCFSRSVRSGNHVDPTADFINAQAKSPTVHLVYGQALEPKGGFIQAGVTHIPWYCLCASCQRTPSDREVRRGGAGLAHESLLSSPFAPQDRPPVREAACTLETEVPA